MSKIIVFVEGGLVQNIIVDEPGIEVLVIDSDNRDDDRNTAYLDNIGDTVMGYGCQFNVYTNTQIVNENFRRANALSGG